MYTNAGAMTGAPYRVVDDSHWAFAGTCLRSGDIFGDASLHERVPGGASGHETDKRTPSSPPGTRLLARGMNVDDGGAEMVHFETPSGWPGVLGWLDHLAGVNPGGRWRLAHHAQRARPLFELT